MFLWLMGCSALMAFVFQAVDARESVEDAAILARKLVDTSALSLGTMATVYPANHPTLAGEPFALQEYYASCHENGSLALLFMPISRHSQNILASPGHTASISIAHEHPDASRARVALIGSVTIYEDLETAPDIDAIQTCYIAKHPDARRWLPGPNEPHIAYWARFDPHTIYYVGGFGSEHFIGYIPMKTYQAAGLSLNYNERHSELADKEFGPHRGLSSCIHLHADNKVVLPRRVRNVDEACVAKAFEGIDTALRIQYGSV